MTQQAQKYTFQLTLQECEIIFAGLGEIPTKLGKPLMDNMQQQFAQQAQVTETPQEVQEQAAE